MEVGKDRLDLHALKTKWEVRIITLCRLLFFQIILSKSAFKRDTTRVLKTFGSE